MNKRRFMEQFHSTSEFYLTQNHVAIIIMDFLIDTSLKLRKVLDTIEDGMQSVELQQQMSSTERSPGKMVANESYSVHTVSSRGVPVYTNEAYGVCKTTTHSEEPEYEVV